MISNWYILDIELKRRNKMKNEIKIYNENTDTYEITIKDFLSTKEANTYRLEESQKRNISTNFIICTPIGESTRGASPKPGDKMSIFKKCLKQARTEAIWFSDNLIWVRYLRNGLMTTANYTKLSLERIAYKNIPSSNFTSDKANYLLNLYFH